MSSPHLHTNNNACGYACKPIVSDACAKLGIIGEPTCTHKQYKCNFLYSTTAHKHMKIAQTLSGYMCVPRTCTCHVRLHSTVKFPNSHSPYMMYEFCVVSVKIRRKPKPNCAVDTGQKMDDSTTVGMDESILPHEMQTPLLFAFILIALIILPQVLCPFNTYKPKDD